MAEKGARAANSSTVTGTLNSRVMSTAEVVAACSRCFAPRARCLEITRERVTGSPLEQTVKNTANTEMAIW